MASNKKSANKKIQQLCSDVRSVFDDLNLEEEDSQHLRAQQEQKREQEEMLARLKEQIDDLS